MKTYGMLIDGSGWRRPKTFDVMNPATDEVIARVPEGRGRRTSTAPSRPRAAPSRAAGATSPPRSAGRILFRLAEKRARASCRARRDRDAQHRQADRRSRVRHRRRRHLLRVLRRPRDEDSRRRAAGARQRDEPGAARADRRRRPDHPVELPAADGGVEAGAGDLRRLHDGAQAGRADAADGPRARAASSRRRAAAGRRQHRDRRRRDRAPRSSRTRTSTRSRSPAASRSARSSCGAPPTR